MATPGRFVVLGTCGASLPLALAPLWLGTSTHADQTPQRVRFLHAFGHATRGALLFALAAVFGWLATIETIAEPDQHQANVLFVESNDPELPAAQLFARGLRSEFS